jgi:hypothetical protein
MWRFRMGLRPRKKSKMSDVRRIASIHGKCKCSILFLITKMDTNEMNRHTHLPSRRLARTRFILSDKPTR